MQYRVNFYEKHGDETRSLLVDACDYDEAESLAADRADQLGWPTYFKVADAQPTNLQQQQSVRKPKGDQN
jgi:hypothetical protein